MTGVSLQFFCAAIKALGRQHGGNRGVAPAIEELRGHLAEAEAAYLRLPLIEKKRRPRKKAEHGQD